MNKNYMIILFVFVNHTEELIEDGGVELKFIRYVNFKSI
jgi:hypothetical protein